MPDPETTVTLAPAGQPRTSIVRPYHFRAARGALGWTQGDLVGMLEARLGRKVYPVTISSIEHSEKIGSMRGYDVYFALVEIYQEAGITFTERGVELDPGRVPVDK